MNSSLAGPIMAAVAGLGREPTKTEVPPAPPMQFVVSRPLQPKVTGLLDLTGTTATLESAVVCALATGSLEAIHSWSLISAEKNGEQITFDLRHSWGHPIQGGES